jgi:hypothetical protein
VAIEVSHLAKVVDLNTNRATAQLACVSLEPFEQLRAFRVRDGWLLIDEDGIFSASDRKAPELSYQGFLPRLTLDHYPKAREHASGVVTQLRYFAAIFVTVLLCLLASVLSIEVSMVHFSR